MSIRSLSCLDIEFFESEDLFELVEVFVVSGEAVGIKTNVYQFSVIVLLPQCHVGVVVVSAKKYILK